MTVDSCGRGSGGSGLIGADGENDTDEYDCESEVSDWFCDFIIIIIILLLRNGEGKGENLRRSVKILTKRVACS